MFHQCSTCQEYFTLDEMCGNARKKITKTLLGFAVSGEALRCKRCEKEDENIRYWAAKHSGFGANAAKNPAWTKGVALSDRRAIVEKFRRFLDRDYDGNIEVYKIAMGQTPEQILYETIQPPNETLLRLKEDQETREIKQRRDADTAEFNNRQTSLKDGYIYVHINPAWPSYAKLGMSLLGDKRLGGYQTYSPFRDWQIVEYWYVDGRRLVESRLKKEILPLYRDDKVRGDEWFVYNDESLDHIRRFILAEVPDRTESSGNQ